jgi:succinate dehydrogenase/fumarate reductase flavoprotein subunit
VLLLVLLLQCLAPEKLRGCGAILLNSSGQRFVDELTTRDKVTAALMEQEGRVAWLVLGAEGSAMFGEGTLGFYGSKSLVKKVRHVLTVT